MPDFTLFLPPEICSTILSHVNQVDCIECMTVCHRWYELIPQCGKDLWTELKISENSSSRCNNAMLECLGTHVKNVNIISPENSNKILRQLERQQCNIQSLEIDARFRIYGFKLDRFILFNGIGLFGRTLKELHMKGYCTHYFSLPLLLDLLPVLTHPTIKFKKSRRLPFKYGNTVNEANKLDIQSSSDNNDNENNDSKHNYNLVFLSMDSEFRHDFYLKKVVKRCPQLKYLLISKDNISESRLRIPLDFTLILELCPSIRYFNWGNDIKAVKTQKDWLTLSRRKKSRDINNDSNSNYEKGGTWNLGQVEFYNDDEQQHVWTLTACLQQPSMLQHLRLYTSSCLNLYQTWNSFRQQNNSLLSRPSQLKSLELVGFHVPKQTRNDILFQDLFNYFEHVEQLTLHFSVASADNLEEERYHLPNLVEAIGHQLHELRYLYLGFVYRNNDERFTKTIVYDNFFTTLCNWNQKLESLHLDNVSISNDILLDLCHHPKLHTLSLSGYYLHMQLTNSGWVSFARKLKEQEQNNNSKGIQTMALSCSSWDIRDQVLEELAGLKSLKTLRIKDNFSISDAGINTFVCVNGGSGKKQKKIELYNCCYSLFVNTQVEFVDFPIEIEFYIYDTYKYLRRNLFY